MQSVRQESIVRRFGRVGLLLSIKESYLFLRNSLGLTVHPYKTLRELKREKDRSQQLLVVGWPFYVLMLGLAMRMARPRIRGVKLVKEIIDMGAFAPKLWVGVEWTLIGLSFLILGYIGYWVLRAWSAGGRDERAR